MTSSPALVHLSSITSRTPRIRFLPNGRANDEETDVDLDYASGKDKRKRGSGNRGAGAGACSRILLLFMGAWFVWWLGKGWLWGPEARSKTSTTPAPEQYRHLNFSHPITLAPSTRIFHIAKEFGPATMGGLGTMLTALAIAQSESPYLSVSVILPYYTFLKSDSKWKGKIKFFTKLWVEVNNWSWWRWWSSEPRRIGCSISILKWEYTSQPNFLTPSTSSSSTKVDQSQLRTIDIYLIHPGDESPFTAAFIAKDKGDIYSAYKPLPQEWKDLWFAKASSELIAHLSYDDGSTMFVNDDFWDDEDGHPVRAGGEAVKVRLKDVTRGVVDVVHLHGATNAMVALYLHQMTLQDVFGSFPPAIVYTLHDSLDEVEYSNTLSNILTFLPRSPFFTSHLEPYTHSFNPSSSSTTKRVFTSALGIDLSSFTTFVSQSIASSIISQEFIFHLSSFILPSLTIKSQQNRFVGITNGLDFTDSEKNPWTCERLVKRGIAFPRVGENVTDFKTLWTSGISSSSPSATVAGGIEGSLTRLSFLSSKTRAKALLVESLPTLFNSEDLQRPWFLFVGRFQYNKGLQFVEPFLSLISQTPSTNARLILMGSPNNYPFSHLQLLEKKFPNHFTLISSSDIEKKGDLQKEWGSTIRMAADYSFVPSFSEAFGLVAAEGLLFGAEIVSTGVGGLGEFLIPINHEDKKGNSYLFSLGKEVGGSANTGVESAEKSRMSLEELAPAVEGMKRVVREATENWRKRNEGGKIGWVEKEMRVRRLVGDALKLKWSREMGPIEEYIRVYDASLRLVRPTRSRTSSSTPSAQNLPLSPSNLERAAGHPLEAPLVVHGGHDSVSGLEGVDALMRNDDNIGKAGSLPIYKVWNQGGGDEEVKKKKKKKKKVGVNGGKKDEKGGKAKGKKEVGKPKGKAKKPG